MPFEEFRFLPLISTRNKQDQREIGYVNYNYAMSLIKGIQGQENEQRKTIFPCWVEAILPNQHVQLQKLANYLLSNELVAGYNFTNHATINLMHIRQLFPDIEKIDLPDDSDHSVTSLIALNTLEASIYEAFSPFTLAYD